MIARYQQGNKYLITRENKKIPYRSYRQIYWDKMCSAIGADNTPHDTRHTFATAADRCNMNRVALKRIMGHSLKDVTEHYTHKNIDELLTEINKIVYCVVTYTRKFHESKTPLNAVVSTHCPP